MNYDAIIQNNNNAMALYSTILKELVYHTQKLCVILKGWVCTNYLGLVVLASVILLFRLKYVLIHPMLSFGLCLSCLILSLEIMLVKLRFFFLIIIHFLKGAVVILYYCRYLLLLLLLFPVCLKYMTFSILSSTTRSIHLHASKFNVYCFVCHHVILI
jgi:hypothetical protein